MISKILKILSLQPRISNVFSITRTFFSHSRSEQFWKQKYYFNAVVSWKCELWTQQNSKQFSKYLSMYSNLFLLHVSKWLCLIIPIHYFWAKKVSGIHISQSSGSNFQIKTIFRLFRVLFKLADRMRSMRTNGASKNRDSWWSSSFLLCI